MSSKLFSVDAETDGLYGEVWAIGAVVYEGDEMVARFEGMIDPATAVTDQWVRRNIVPVVHLPLFVNRSALFQAFWSFWLNHRPNALCIADFGTPVEAGLFRACVEMDLPARNWDGPYPLHELGTALLLTGIDPDIDRRDLCNRYDLVHHDPVDDAITAALCWRIVENLRNTA